jgi:hypothetical protein
MRRGQLVEDTAVTNRQALSMAVLAKLHIAYQQYLAAAREYRWADQLASVDRRLYQQIANRAETDAQSQLERVSARVSAVVSDIKRYRDYAEAQAALGRLYDAVGIDPVPNEVVALDIKSLSAAIRRSSSDWDNNRIDRLSQAEPPAAASDAVVARETAPETAQAWAPQQSALAADERSVVQ